MAVSPLVPMALIPVSGALQGRLIPQQHRAPIGLRWLNSCGSPSAAESSDQYHADQGIKSQAKTESGHGARVALVGL